ncbi:hypothetical protein AB0K48_22105, partial [Nonomuraea sp. NPDC055795]
MSRTSHLIRRLLAALVTVYAVVTLNFLLFRVLPGDAVARLPWRPDFPFPEPIDVDVLGLDGDRV